MFGGNYGFAPTQHLMKKMLGRDPNLGNAGLSRGVPSVVATLLSLPRGHFSCSPRYKWSYRTAQYWIF